MADQSGESPPAGLVTTLSPALFARAFPFHFACDEALAVVQAGASLRRIAPGVRPGVKLADEFLSLRPAGELTGEFFVMHEETLVLLEHRASKLRFQGQFARTSNPAGWVFLGSPWFTSADALEAAGLTLDDFARHDPVTDLLVLAQAQTIAIADLQQLNVRLDRGREELRHTQELYRAAIAAANLVPYQETLHDDTFTYLGEDFAALTGYEPGEVSPSKLRALEELPAAPAADASTAVNRQGLDWRPSRRTFPFTTRDGRLRWFADNSVTVHDHAGQPVGAIGILEDITARRLAEQRLRESEENAQRLAAVTARTDNLVVLTDARGRVEWVNEAFVRVTGYTLEQMRGRIPGHVLQGPDTDPFTVNRLRTAVAAGEYIKCEILNYRRDGTGYWLDIQIHPMRNAQGEVTRFMAVEVDITARKQYERQLSQLHDELDAILRLIPGGIVAFNADDMVTYCNDAFARMLGLPVERVRGLHARDVDHVLASLCAPKDPPYSLADLSHGGYERIRLVTPSPAVIARTDREYRDAHGARQWHVVYLRDATHETELDRMKTEFLTTAAHELRTPMSSVHGFAELLMSRDFDATTARAIARTIHRQSSLLVEMVTELLDVARIESGGGRDFVLEKLPLAPLVRETEASLLMPGDARQVEVIRASGDSAIVNVDSAQLRRAITNVLSNAYKYSRGKGVIRVSLPRRTHRGRTEVGVRVQDEGLGMTPEQLSRLFERFYRADPSGEIPGTGLGMTLVKQIMEALQGSVDVESLAGRGTTVTLWLPVVDRVGGSGDQSTRSGESALQLIWQEGYACGEPMIDAEHQQLFELANALIAASIARQTAPAELVMAIDQLIDGIARHFADEEALLAARGFGGLQQHREAHAAILARAASLQAQVREGTASTGALVDFLANDVVVRHVLNVDRDYFPLFSGTAGR